MKHNLSGTGRGTPAPALITAGITGCLVLGLVFGRDLKRLWASQFQPRISFARPTPRPASPDAVTPPASAPAVLFASPDARTETRLREAVGVALAASLVGLADFADGHPVQNVAALRRGLTARGLLPPGVTLAADGRTLTGQYGVLHLRWRVQPCAVEVLALGREAQDGPALLVRVPEETTSGDGATRYFTAQTLTQVTIPPPFASSSALLATGWQVAVLRPATPTGDATPDVTGEVAPHSQTPRRDPR